jgi:hypothetical protein
MEKCAKCSLDAKYQVVKRLNLIPVAPTFLCEIHRREYDRNEHVFVVVGLAIALVLALMSLQPWTAFDADRALPSSPTAAAQLDGDLDGDGRVAWFEEQAIANPEAMRSLEQVGYPFAAVLLPDSPTRPIKKKISVEAFLRAAHTPDENGETLVVKFNHPGLMERFINKHNGPGAETLIHALYLTHDPYLAVVLAAPESEEFSLICLEKLTQDQETAIEALDSAPVKNETKTP